MVAVRTPERMLLTPWRTTPPLVQIEQADAWPVWMHADAITEVLDG